MSPYNFTSTSISQIKGTFFFYSTEKQNFVLTQDLTADFYFNKEPFFRKQHFLEEVQLKKKPLDNVTEVSIPFLFQRCFLLLFIYLNNPHSRNYFCFGPLRFQMVGNISPTFNSAVVCSLITGSNRKQRVAERIIATTIR